MKQLPLLHLNSKRSLKYGQEGSLISLALPFRQGFGSATNDDFSNSIFTWIKINHGRLNLKNEFLLVSPACFLSWCPHKGNSNDVSETL